MVEYVCMPNFRMYSGICMPNFRVLKFAPKNICHKLQYIYEVQNQY